jgi:hypothetical protein
MSWVSIQDDVSHQTVAGRLVGFIMSFFILGPLFQVIFSSQFTHPSIKPSNILVDAVSFALLNGSTIDFAVELIGSTFRVAHNPQAKGSGCGCGVSWELKD